MITDEQKEQISWRIREEGIDYTFEGYSHWEEVEDPKFHELRKNYLAAAEAIKEYIDYEKYEE